MAGKGRKVAAVEPVTTPKRKRSVKEEKKIPVIAKKDAAVKKVTVVKKKGRVSPVKKEKKEETVAKKTKKDEKDQKASKVVGKAKNETPKKKEVKTASKKKETPSKVKSATKATPEKKKHDDKKAPMKKAKVVKKVKKDSPLKKKKEVEKPSKGKKVAEPRTPKKKEKKEKEAKEEMDEPSTSGASKSAKRSTKKSEAPSPTDLVSTEDALLYLIELEERKGEKLARKLKEKEEKVKEWEEVERLARKEKVDAVNQEAEMINKLKRAGEHLETDNHMIRIFKEKDGAQRELQEVLDRRLIQLTSVMEQRDIQSAHRGREALKQRIENRHLKRFLSAIRSYISRLAVDHPSSPFVERLLEIAQEDYSPLEETRRMRQVVAAAGFAPRRMLHVDLTHL